MFRSHLCISFELLAINLYDFIKHNNFCGLSLGLIRRFAHQILIALQFMKVCARARHPRRLGGASVWCVGVGVAAGT